MCILQLHLILLTLRSYIILCIDVGLKFTFRKHVLLGNTAMKLSPISIPDGDIALPLPLGELLLPNVHLLLPEELLVTLLLTALNETFRGRDVVHGHLHGGLLGALRRHAIV
jgi:hypothetical protein